MAECVVSAMTRGGGALMRWKVRIDIIIRIWITVTRGMATMISVVVHRVIIITVFVIITIIVIIAMTITIVAITITVISAIVVIHAVIIYSTIAIVTAFSVALGLAVVVVVIITGTVIPAVRCSAVQSCNIGWVIVLGI